MLHLMNEEGCAVRNADDRVSTALQTMAARDLMKSFRIAVDRSASSKFNSDIGLSRWDKKNGNNLD